MIIKKNRQFRLRNESTPIIINKIFINDKFDGFIVVYYWGRRSY
jgi:hypothetical protein